jgi:signal transduction histidine kinase
LPETLIRLGLEAALSEFTKSIEQSGLLKINYSALNLSRLSPNLELTIFRIIQELISNIVKHSGATEALLQLQQDDKSISITVEDNGKGFRNETEKNGIGLSNVRSRVSSFNGSLDIQSHDTSGTSVFISFQLN